MLVATTNGVKVTVGMRYHPGASDPVNSKYVFMYKIQIENLGSYTVQLQTRHWKIFDSFAPRRSVSGIGVVGEKPIIEPGEKYEYESGCSFVSEWGKMEGRYVFERLFNGEKFNVKVPDFILYPVYRLN